MSHPLIPSGGMRFHSCKIHAGTLLLAYATDARTLMTVSTTPFGDAVANLCFCGEPAVLYFRVGTLREPLRPTMWPIA